MSTAITKASTDLAPIAKAIATGLCHISNAVGHTCDEWAVHSWIHQSLLRLDKSTTQVCRTQGAHMFQGNERLEIDGKASNRTAYAPSAHPLVIVSHTLSVLLNKPDPRFPCWAVCAALCGPPPTVHDPQAHFWGGPPLAESTADGLCGPLAKLLRVLCTAAATVIDWTSTTQLLDAAKQRYTVCMTESDREAIGRLRVVLENCHSAAGCGSRGFTIESMAPLFNDSSAGQLIRATLLCICGALRSARVVLHTPESVAHEAQQGRDTEALQRWLSESTPLFDARLDDCIRLLRSGSDAVGHH